MAVRFYRPWWEHVLMKAAAKTQAWVIILAIVALAVFWLCREAVGFVRGALLQRRRAHIAANYSSDPDVRVSQLYRNQEGGSDGNR